MKGEEYTARKIARSRIAQSPAWVQIPIKKQPSSLLEPHQKLQIEFCYDLGYFIKKEDEPSSLGYMGAVRISIANKNDQFDLQLLGLFDGLIFEEPAFIYRAAQKIAENERLLCRLISHRKTKQTLR